MEKKETPFLTSLAKRFRFRVPTEKDNAHPRKRKKRDAARGSESRVTKSTFFPSSRKKLPFFSSRFFSSRSLSPFSTFVSQPFHLKRRGALEPNHNARPTTSPLDALSLLFLSKKNSSRKKMERSFFLSRARGQSPRPRRPSWGRRQCPSARPSRATR